MDLLEGQETLSKSTTSISYRLCGFHITQKLS